MCSEFRFPRLFQRMTENLEDFTVDEFKAYAFIKAMLKIRGCIDNNNEYQILNFIKGKLTLETLESNSLSIYNLNMKYSVRYEDLLKQISKDPCFRIDDLVGEMIVICYKLEYTLSQLNDLNNWTQELIDKLILYKFKYMYKTDICKGQSYMIANIETTKTYIENEIFAQKLQEKLNSFYSNIKFTVTYEFSNFYVEMVMIS